VLVTALCAGLTFAHGQQLPSIESLNESYVTCVRSAFARRKPTTRTHFVYRIDILTDDGKNILEHLAGLENLIVARAAYRAACERWPNARITLRQGARIMEDSRRRQSPVGRI
jgi:hypothetical protein